MNLFAFPTQVAQMAIDGEMPFLLFLVDVKEARAVIG
jgi:hypothetical protein